MKRFLISLLFVCGSVLADTTANLITNNPTQWSGIGGYSQLSGQLPGALWGCCTSYSWDMPFFDTSTGSPNGQSGQFHWSYGQYTVQQIIAINQALAGVGAGVQISGYNWGYEVRNMNGTGGQGGVDSLTATTFMTNTAGTRILSDTRVYNTAQDWNWHGGTVNAATPIDLANAGNLGVEFTSRDSGFWAGYYGPQVRNVSMSLNYTVDPCTTNPAYSPSCSGYNTVSISDNLLPGTTGTQAYAINQALALAGAGATIHGFDYGYNYNVAGRTCAIFDIFGLCLTGYNYSSAGVATVITDSDSNTIFSETTTHNGGNSGTSGSYSNQYRLTSSVPMSTLGAFAMSAWNSGSGSITGMYSNAVYTADPCVSNPLYSTSCAGYAQAYFDQQCSANPLYNAACPGYQQAYHDQQCSANPLYATSCSGYQQAYYTQQCTLNPLYDSACPGYAQAYFDQQCSLNGLYSRDCPNYAEAYARQNLLSQNNSSTTTNTTTTTTASTTEPTVQVKDDGKVSTEVQVVSDSTVNDVITKKTEVKSETTTQTTQPTQTQTQTAAQPTQTQTAQQTEKKQEQKKTDTEIAKIEKKSESKDTKTSSKSKEEAKKEATEKAKELANDMSKAATLEAQAANQGVVLGLMNYVPGFSAYQNSIVPDINAITMNKQYNKNNVDNRRAMRQLSGASDRLHQEMVDGQYR